MNNKAEERIINIKNELRKATKEAVELSYQLSELEKPGSNATEEQIAAVSERLSEATNRASELKDLIGDTNKRIANLASGSKFEQLSNIMGDIGSKIKSFNFSQAQVGASDLLKVSKSITFKDAIGSLNSLGSTFLQIGKSLITNPLFLLAAAISSLVIIVGKVIDKLGLMKIITEQVGKVFDWLIGLLEKTFLSIADFFGITSKAEREATEAMVRNAEQAQKNLKLQEKINEEVIQRIDNEIRMYKLLGKDTEELERKKVEQIRNTAKERYKADLLAYQAALAQNKLTREEIENLKEKARISRLAAQQATADLIYFEEKIKKEKEDNRKKDKENQEKISKEIAEKRKSDYEKALKEKREYEKDRLKISREIKDLELSLMLDGIEKDLAINKEKYNRLIKDTIDNEKILKEEKNKIIELLEQEAIKAENNIIETYRKNKEEKEKEHNDKLLNLQKEYHSKFNKIGLNEFEKSILELEDKYKEDLELLNNFFNEKIISEEEYNSKIISLKKEKDEKEEKIRKEAIEKEKKEIRDKLEQDTKDLKEGLKSLSEAFSSLGTVLGSELSLGIGRAFIGINNLIEISQKEFEDSTKGRIEMFKSYTQSIGESIQSFLSLAIQFNNDKLKKQTENIELETNLQTDILKKQLDNRLISQEEYDESIRNLNEKANKEKDIIGRKSFEDNKKLQISQATIAGLQGIVQAFAGAMSLGPIAGPIVGSALSSAVASLTAINISKIKSTKYGSSNSSTGSSSGISSYNSSNSSSITPSFNLFGSNNNSNTVGNNMQNNNNYINVNVKSQVSVSEINTIQNKVAVQEERASL
jgi:hypothetical protein